MESILSMPNEVYPLKSRRNKSIGYLSNTVNIKSNILSLFYQYIKTTIAQRSVYILGILNLILAGVAIICVTQAEDHPEYFSLVYIAVSIFVFYMVTILVIIILQIIETYQEQYQRNRSSVSLQQPLLTPQKTTQSTPMIVESLVNKTQAKTRLSRSQTLPLTSLSLYSHHTLSPSPSTLTDSNPITSTRLALLPNHQSSMTNPPKSYQSFAFTANAQLCPSCTTLTNHNSNPHLSQLIKPIPLKHHANSENNKPKTKFLEY